MYSTHKVAFSSFVVVLIFFALVSAVKYSKAPRHVKAIDRVQSRTTETTVKTNYIEQQNMLHMEASYRNLAPGFEPNRGQTDPRVKFLSRAANRTLWLTTDEAVLAVDQPSRSRFREAGAAGQATDGLPAVLRMKFRGANASPKVAGEDKQPGIVNYFVGSREQWRTRIPMYARVRYRGIYPGVDLMFYGNNRELEYDLVVFPEGDPRQIRLAIDGAQKIRIDAAGNLVLDTSAGEVIQHKARIY